MARSPSLNLAAELTPRIKASNAGCVRFLRSTHARPMFRRRFTTRIIRIVARRSRSCAASCRIVGRMTAQS